MVHAARRRPGAHARQARHPPRREDVQHFPHARAQPAHQARGPGGGARAVHGHVRGDVHRHAVLPFAGDDPGPALRPPERRVVPGCRPLRDAQPGAPFHRREHLGARLSHLRGGLRGRRLRIALQPGALQRHAEHAAQGRGAAPAPRRVSGVPHRHGQPPGPARPGPAGARGWSAHELAGPVGGLARTAPGLRLGASGRGPGQVPPVLLMGRARGGALRVVELGPGLVAAHLERHPALPARLAPRLLGLPPAQAPALRGAREQRPVLAALGGGRGHRVAHPRAAERPPAAPGRRRDARHRGGRVRGGNPTPGLRRPPAAGGLDAPLGLHCGRRGLGARGPAAPEPPLLVRRRVHARRGGGNPGPVHAEEAPAAHRAAPRPLPAARRHGRGPGPRPGGPAGPGGAHRGLRGPGRLRAAPRGAHAPLARAVARRGRARDRGAHVVGQRAGDHRRVPPQGAAGAAGVYPRGRGDEHGDRHQGNVGGDLHGEHCARDWPPDGRHAPRGRVRRARRGGPPLPAQDAAGQAVRRVPLRPGGHPAALPLGRGHGWKAHGGCAGGGTAGAVGPSLAQPPAAAPHAAATAPAGPPPGGAEPPGAPVVPSGGTRPRGGPADAGRPAPGILPAARAARARRLGAQAQQHLPAPPPAQSLRHPAHRPRQAPHAHHLRLQGAPVGPREHGHGPLQV
mmetsp:Transcript_1606/g.5176  ORF Transcript_1606/g.5176 Transcript_1606/m.5176 type:complete len:683 (-) Transcript_1606:759-2807(-)